MANVNDSAVVTVSGTAQQGKTLTAVVSDADGVPATGVSYQWLANGVAITGATGANFTLTQAQVGKAITVKTSFKDNLGTAESKTSAATAAVANVNDAPTGTSKALTVLEDGSKVFSAADFGFTDADGNTLKAVLITTLPKAGTLKLNGVSVTANQSIAVADLGKLVFTPAANANGTGYASIGFKVQDNGGTANGGVDTSAAATLTINVTPVNDAPTGTSKALTMLEDGSKVFSAADFGFTDADGNTLKAVLITTLPKAGTLKLNGVSVTANQSIAVADLGKLVFTPAANANGTGYASIGFKVQDNGGTANGGVDTSAAATLTINVTPVKDVLSVDSDTALGKSLKELQKLTVENVMLTGAAATGGLTVALGDGAALNASGLPQFGIDGNNDGQLTGSEIGAGNVTLAVTGATQLGEAASLAGGLNAAGIDAVRIDLANGLDSNSNYNAELTALLGDSTLNADLTALHNAGLVATQIDLGGAGVVGHVTLSDEQAHQLIGAGLEFAAADMVGLEAAGTHLSTSLKSLQKLGVDNVLLSGAAATDGLTIALGDGAALSATGLPLFGDSNGDGVLSQSELDAGHVTLTVATADQLGEAAALASGLHAAGIDAVRMDLVNGLDGNANYNAELSALLGDSTLNADLTALHNAGLVANQIDLGGVGEIGHVTLSDAQAQVLIGEGLEFAAADHIALDIGSAAGTHLSTSLKDLQKLGVDNVLLADGAGHSLTVDLGTGAALSASGLPLFGDTDGNGLLSANEDKALDVTLSVASHSDLQGLKDVAGALNAAGIDHIAVGQSELGDLLASDGAVSSLISAGLDFDVHVGGSVASSHARFEQVVDIVKNGTDLVPDSLAGANLGDLAQTLKGAGIHAIDLDANASVTIGDDLAAALHDAGLLTALPKAEVWIDTSAAQLQTSLKAMADLGVDKVVASTSDVVVKLGADVGELGTLLKSFVEDGTASTTKPLFDHLAQLDVGIVTDDAAVQATLSQAGVAQQLHDLGVSKVVAQVEVLGHAGQFQTEEWTFSDHWTKTTV